MLRADGWGGQADATGAAELQHEAQQQPPYSAQRPRGGGQEEEDALAAELLLGLHAAGHPGAGGGGAGPNKRPAASDAAALAPLRATKTARVLPEPPGVGECGWKLVVCCLPAAPGRSQWRVMTRVPPNGPTS